MVTNKEKDTYNVYYNSYVLKIKHLDFITSPKPFFTTCFKCKTFGQTELHFQGHWWRKAYCDKSYQSNSYVPFLTKDEIRILILL